MRVQGAAEDGGTAKGRAMEHIDGRAGRVESAGGVTSLVADLHPGYAALVMATGIVSTGFARTGFAVLSWLLLGIAVISFVLLLVAYGWRLVAWPRRVAADARDPSRGFGFFSLVAAANVVGTALARNPAWLPVAEVLCLFAAALWSVLTYAVIGSLVAARADDGSGPQRSSGPPVLARADGSWFLLVVSTQSLAAAAATIAADNPTWTQVLTPIAIALWGVGVIQYLLLAGLLIVGLLEEPGTPTTLAPSYWIYMGATAITVLAAANILTLDPTPVLRETGPVLSGSAFLLWAFGTWWIPLLIIFTIRRHLVSHGALLPRYEPGSWSVAFPLGMYAVACDSYGKLTGVGFMITLARIGVWVGLAVWLVIAATMVRSALRHSTA